MVKRLIAPLLLVLPVASAASVLDRLYDFTDAYYRANGVDSTKLGGRKQAPSASAVVDAPNKPIQRSVRIIGTTVGYGASGSPMFFSVMGGGGPEIFTNDAAGQKARGIADSFAEYIFPKKGGNPVGIPGSRQAFLHDNSHGYFSNDPLGLWIHVWVNYTDKAFNTTDGKKALADLQKKNGLALDGTPIIRTTSEIDSLFSKGYVTKLTTNDATRYAVCPEILDPRDGGIAPDAFATFNKLPDGTLLEPALADAFYSLQKTGDWPHGR